MTTAVENAMEAAVDASEAELVRYEKAYRETRRVLDESIETLMVLEEFESTPERRDQVALKRLELEASRADLVRANIAFHAGRTTMNPPSAALVSEIVELSKQAAELTVERATVAAALRLATGALNRFARIQDIANG